VTNPSPPSAAPAPHQAGLLKWPDLLTRPRPEPDATVRYGEAALQVVDVWLPKRSGRHPVVVLIHGGCWQSEVADRRIMNWIADDLRKRGIAVWNIDYRGVDRAGGGYPGTFADVAAAADALREHAAQYKLDLSSVVALGHSAGGHLALWLAGREERGYAPFSIAVEIVAPGASVQDLEGLSDVFKSVGSPNWETSAGGGRFTGSFRFPAGTDPETALARIRGYVPELRRRAPQGASEPRVDLLTIPAGSPLLAEDPLWVRAVVASGALPDLRLTETPPGTGCGTEVVRRLVGTATAQRSDLFADTSAAELSRIRARQILVNGEEDKVVPLAFAAAYRDRRAQRGESVELETLPHTGHVELIAPESPAWRRQVEIIQKIFREKPNTVTVREAQP
jgi:acetyl esterase/lipase